jgi:hypothetical protein
VRPRRSGAAQINHPQAGPFELSYEKPPISETDCQSLIVTRSARHFQRPSASPCWPPPRPRSPNHFGRFTPSHAEAARRAGIRPTRIRIIVFGISGTIAAIGGILAASRLLAVDNSSGGSDLLLFAIAGPVIAGTSLFCGRGSVWSALLGALLMGSISNGMDLLALQSSVKFMVTAACWSPR